MFTIKRRSDTQVEHLVRLAAQRPLSRPEYLNASGDVARVPRGFALDRMRTMIQTGEQAFVRGIRAFESWKHLDLGWVRVANHMAKIDIGQIAAVEVHSLGLWSLNLSQIVDVVRTENRFAFLYKTTRQHLEDGEERFALTFDRRTDEVWYETEAVSRPRYWMARIGFPVTRSFQHRFARDSHARMRQIISADHPPSLKC